MAATQACYNPSITRSTNLSPREVQLWRAKRISSSADLPHDSLSSEEQERADRFRSEHDRHRFVLGRIVAKSVLGHYLQRPMGDVRLTLDHAGKPVVASPSDTSIHFNISHSGDHVLFAVARDRRVGVDVEQVRETKDLEEIAARYFSRIEYSRLLTVPERMRTESFYRCWTMKEAYLKARGEGFGLPLDSFDVAFLSSEIPRLLETRFEHVDASRWCFHKVNLGAAYLAALVTEGGPEIELKVWDWNVWQQRVGLEASVLYNGVSKPIVRTT